MDTPMLYEITLQERLGAQWEDWFLPLVIQILPNGYTTLRGRVRDQGELHGTLEKIRDLNLTLIALRRIADL